MSSQTTHNTTVLDAIYVISSSSGESDKRIPHGAFVHQLYGYLINKTLVDQDIQYYRDLGVIRCINCALYTNDGMFVMFNQELMKKIDCDSNQDRKNELWRDKLLNILKCEEYKSRMSFTREELMRGRRNSKQDNCGKRVRDDTDQMAGDIDSSHKYDNNGIIDGDSIESGCIHNKRQKFIDEFQDVSENSQIVSTNCRISVCSSSTSLQHSLRETISSEITIDDINQLIQVRYLAFAPGSDHGVWLCHPYIGILCKYLSDGNKELLQIIRRKRFNEAYDDELIYSSTSKKDSNRAYRQLKTSILQVQYHLYDLVGRGLLTRIESSSCGRIKNLYRIK